jgi:uncharacterized protein (TIGR02099 family)
VIHHVTRATRHLLFWSLIAAAVLLSAVRILLADIADYRVELEQKITQTTGIPIRIGTISAGMRGFNPQVLLRDIAVAGADAARQPAIQLQEVRIGLDLLDLLLTRDLLTSSWVTLVGAKIDVIRTVDGNLIIKGLQASDEQPLWLLQGSKYEILQSDISWQDQKRGMPPVHFEQFDLLLKNHHFNGNHELHLLSRLPAQYGESLRISASLTGDLFAASHITGQLYIEGINLQASAVIAGDLPFGLDLQSGEGDVRLWSRWRDSKPYQVAGYLQAQQIDLKRDQGKTVHLDTFDGNVVWSADDKRWRLGGYDINLFANRQRWSSGEFYLQQDSQGALAVLIKQLQLPALMHFAPLISPDDSEYTRWLALNPKGRLQNINLFADNQFQHYALTGEFQNAGTDAYQSVPQFQHLSGKISATEQYGALQLDTAFAQLNAPGWFRNLLEIRRLEGSLNWWQGDGGWQIFSHNLGLDSADFKTVSDLNLWLPAGDASPSIAMRTRFSEFNNIGNVPLYLPANIMSKDAVAWLDPAFVAGRIPRGEMLLYGQLDQFPFTDGGGKFETVFVIENGEIQVNEDWPHLRDIYADVQFLGADLQVSIAEGRSEQVGINQAVVTIADLANSDHVYVLGKLQAKFMDSLQYLLKTPIRRKIAALPELMTGEGSAQIDLDLNIPFYETMPVDVDVNAHFQKVNLKLTPIDLNIAGITGVMNFTEDRISSDLMAASTLGFPIQARFSSDQQASYLDIDGLTSVDNLEKQFAFLQTDVARGNFAYHSHLTLPYDAAQADSLNIRSNLKGVAIDSDYNLAKAADAETPLELDFLFDTTQLMPLQVRYGSQLQAALLIDKPQNRLHSAHVVLGTGQASRYQTAGMKLEIRQPQFNLSQAVGSFTESSAKTAWPPMQEVLIDSGQVVWQGQELGPMQLHFEHRDQAWQGVIDSVMAKGELRIPDQRAGNNRIDLNMDFLNLSAMDKINLDGADEVVTELPLIDIDSKRLLWRSVDLGHLKLQTERLLNGIHFKKVQLRGEKSKIDFSADWLKRPGGTNTQINGNLSMEGFGPFLAELGITEDIKETTANIGFNGGWNGAPQQFSAAKLNGQLTIDLDDGRISSIEPGFGRLLGLIAMEQWVKRLSLDFTDIYRQGLAFDHIGGHFKINDGLASTSDLNIDAVAAKFSIAGYVNLVNKTIDQRVAVVPKSSGALPIAGTIVGGIATLITKVVTDDYKDGYFFGSQYQLSGAWGNVEVSPLHDQDGLVKKTWHGLTDFGWLESITK